MQDGGGEPVVDKMMGIGTQLKLKCEESGEELQLVRCAGLVGVAFDVSNPRGC